MEGAQQHEDDLTLLNSTGLKMSMRSEKSFWMLLSRWVSMGALGMVTSEQSGTAKNFRKPGYMGIGTQGTVRTEGERMQRLSGDTGTVCGHKERGT